MFDALVNVESFEVEPPKTGAAVDNRLREVAIISPFGEDIVDDWFLE